MYRGADKSLARPTSRYNFFDGENISFDASLITQGDSGEISNTLGNDSMCDSKPKSPYEHGFDFGPLRSYGHLLIPVHALV